MDCIYYFMQINDVKTTPLERWLRLRLIFRFVLAVEEAAGLIKLKLYITGPDLKILI